MKSNLKIISVCIVLLLLTSCASSTKRYYPKITGEVVDNDKPVINAKIKLTFVTKKKNLSYLRQTDLNGSFSFPEISKLIFTGGYSTQTHGSSTYYSTIYGDVIEVNITIISGLKKYIGYIGKKDFILKYEKYNSLNLKCDINRNLKNESICITMRSKRTP